MTRKAKKLALAGVLVLVTPPLLLWWAVVQPGVQVRACEPQPVSLERLEADVRLFAQTFAPRSHRDVGNLNAVADHLAQAFDSAGAVVDEQRYTDRTGVERRNVIARYGPDTREVVVVGAHYDAHGPHPAADDNASGVAALLELARMLGRTPPDTRVELVAYANEEQPFSATVDMGSMRHAARLREPVAAVKAGEPVPSRNVRAMISLEMLGYFSDAPSSQRFPLSALKWFYPDVGNYIVVVGRLEDIPLTREVKGAMRGVEDLRVRSINAPRSIPGVDFSDHASYWEHGFPAVMITDTAFYRNPNYHTPRDTPDTLDYERMGRVVEGVYCAVQSLGESDQ